MSERIVYTEKLITSMGLQIGDMADRIVDTENIMGNLTERCLDCKVSESPLVEGTFA
jgi:hypothetical protein